MDDDDFPMEDTVLDSTELNAVAEPLPGSHGNNMHRLDISTESGSVSDAMDVSDSPKPSYLQQPQVVIPLAPPSYPPLPYSSSRTGLVYDSRMRFHSEPTSLMIKVEDIHPEDPRRIHAIFQEIKQAGLVQEDGDSQLDEDTQKFKCVRIQARYATEAEIRLVHTSEHWQFIESLQHRREDELISLANSMDSIYFNGNTFESATLAAGGAIEACRAVVRGDVRNSIAIIRPPGHHAECDSPSGFCIFNNVPIAAKVCQENFPEKCRKVLILDWDVHHGNGIQHSFYKDPNVLYISIHVFKNGEFYPSLPDANYDYSGEGPGLGKNVNIPWADIGMGDAEYLYAFQQVVMPIATEFDPDLVIISAGFDAAEGDALGGCHVTPACYAHMTHMLMSLAKGKIAVCLEGGYNLRSIARSALAVTRTLMLEAPDRLGSDLNPNESAVRTIEQVKREQSKYWKCMYPKEVSKDHPSFHSTVRLHDIIREWQAKVLQDEYFMAALTIKRELLSETFEHNIIATPGFMQERPLLVIFHDPPDVMGIGDPTTGKTELHNTWLTDATKGYIDWAIKNGFEVIDINIPKVVMIEDDETGYVRSDNAEHRASQTRDIARYLWENYIEPSDASQIFLMGVGAPYLGLVDLVSNQESLTEDDRVECLVGFVAETPIQSVKRATDDNIGIWYHQHSLIFVAHEHHLWSAERQRKIRRKYGNLKRADHNSLREMLVRHRPEVIELLEEKVIRSDESSQEGIRSPPLNLGMDKRGASLPSGPSGLKSPKLGQLPPMGYFTVANSPRSPRSPLKRTFDRA